MSNERKFLTFDDLCETEVVERLIVTPYGREEWVRLGALTSAEWHDTIAEVKRPVVPHTKMTASGVKEPNKDDVGYLRDMAKYDRQVRNRLLVVSFEKGGMEIPGDTLDAQMKAMENGDEGILSTAFRVLNGMSREGEGLIADQIERFRLLSSIEASRLEAIQHEARRLGSVVRSVENGHDRGGRAEAATVASDRELDEAD